MSGMTIKSSRRWFQFSIRTALLGMTVIAVLLARISYLKQYAVFHEREATKWREKVAVDNKASVQQIRELSELFRQPQAFMERTGKRSKAKMPLEVKIIHHHEDMAVAYRQAVWRPWTSVRELPPSNWLDD